MNLKNLLVKYDGVIIDFFRGIWWDYWRKHLNDLNKNLSEFETRNVKLISISSDSANLQNNFKKEHDITIDMIPDRGAKIANDYKVGWLAVSVGTLKTKQAVPSKFLINKDGEIVWKYIGKDKTDRPFLKMIPLLVDNYIKNPKWEWLERAKMRLSMTTLQGF